ncbi:MAG: hypothetical protein QM831_21540 [Kofleriaceae bacterium]
MKTVEHGIAIRRANVAGPVTRQAAVHADEIAQRGETGNGHRAIAGHHIEQVRILIRHAHVLGQRERRRHERLAVRCKPDRRGR